MKQLVKVAVLPVLALVFLAACSDVHTNSAAAKEEDQVAVTESIPPPAGIQLKNDKLNALYQQYTQLTAALIKGDVKEARFAGNAIEAGAREVDGGERLGVSAAKITATADIEEQRAAFSILSNDLITLVKKSGVHTGQLYVDFCPMAMNDEGARWLSADKAIQNPYFGEKMMTCGEVKETIQ